MVTIRTIKIHQELFENKKQIQFQKKLKELNENLFDK